MTRELILRAPAKINWSLGIQGRREDGYHVLDSLMQSISWYDTVRLTPAEDDLCQCLPDPCCDQTDNLAMKAWRLMRDVFHLPGGMHILIEKHIPAGAGLGGGSSDAAAVLLGVRELYGLEISFLQLLRRSFSLGADLPFCLTGGMALVEGAGEVVRSCRPSPLYDLLLVDPGESLSTAAVFSAFDEQRRHSGAPDLSRLMPALLTRDLPTVAAGIGNMLEPAAIRLCPRVGEAKRILERAGCITLMSGSGSCLWAMPQKAEKDWSEITRMLEENDFTWHRVQTLDTGIEIL